MRKHTILCVDDEPHILTALRRTFREMSDEVTVVTVGSAKEALSAIAEQSVSLIVCDQRMPGMSGTEFLSRARVIAPNALRILLTGYIEARTLEEAVNMGQIFRFISKPWDNEELLRAVREALSIYERNVYGKTARAGQSPRPSAAPNGPKAPAKPTPEQRRAAAPPAPPRKIPPKPQQPPAHGSGAHAVPPQVRAQVAAGPGGAGDVINRLTEAMPFAMFSIDDRGTIRMANAFARRLCRLNHLPVIGSHFTTALPLEIRRTVELNLGRNEPVMLSNVLIHGNEFHLQCHPFKEGGAEQMAIVVFPQVKMRDANQEIRAAG